MAPGRREHVPGAITIYEKQLICMLYRIMDNSNHLRLTMLSPLSASFLHPC